MGRDVKNQPQKELYSKNYISQYIRGRPQKQPFGKLYDGTVRRGGGTGLFYTQTFQSDYAQLSSS